MKKRWLILFSLVALISLLGVGLTGQEGNFTLPEGLSFGNDIGGLIGNPVDFFLFNHVG